MTRSVFRRNKTKVEKTKVEETKVEEPKVEDMKKEIVDYSENLLGNKKLLDFMYTPETDVCKVEEKEITEITKVALKSKRKPKKKRAKKVKAPKVEEPKVEEPKVEEPKVEGEKNILEKLTKLAEKRKLNTNTNLKKEKLNKEKVLNNLSILNKERVKTKDTVKKMKEVIIFKDTDTKKIEELKKKVPQKTLKEKMVHCNTTYKIDINLETETRDITNVTFVNDGTVDKCLLELKFCKSKKTLQILEFHNNKWNRKTTVALRHLKNTIKIKPAQHQVPIQVMNTTSISIRRQNHKIAINQVKWNLDNFSIV